MQRHNVFFLFRNDFLFSVYPIPLFSEEGADELVVLETNVSSQSPRRTRRRFPETARPNNFSLRTAVLDNPILFPTAPASLCNSLFHGAANDLPPPVTFFSACANA